MDTTLAAAARRFTVLGTTDEHSGCDCCGRENLRTYVVMRDTETGEVAHFGTGCAAKLEKVPAAEIRGEARDADRAKRAAEVAAENARRAADDARWFAFLAANTAAVGDVAAQIDELGGYSAARTAYRAA